AELALDVDGKADGLEGAVEGGLDGIALDVENPSLVVRDQGLKEIDAPHHAAVRAELVPLHRGGVVDDIGKQDRRQTLPYRVATRRGHKWKLLFPLIFRTLAWLREWF